MIKKWKTYFSLHLSNATATSRKLTPRQLEIKVNCRSGGLFTDVWDIWDEQTLFLYDVLFLTKMVPDFDRACLVLSDERSSRIGKYSSLQTSNCIAKQSNLRSVFSLLQLSITYAAMRSWLPIWLVTCTWALFRVQTWYWIPRILAHPPILAQCKVHCPWAPFREGTVYHLFDGAPLWDNARCLLRAHSFPSVITSDDHIDRTGLVSSHVPRDQYPRLGS